MRHLYVLIVTLLWAATTSSAQNPKSLYIKYSNDCMTRMQYSSTYGKGGDEVHYYASSQAQKTLVMVIRKAAPMGLAKLPASAKSCHEVNFNPALAWQCNTGGTEVYVVTQTAGGYQAHYVESISMLEKTGSTTHFDSFLYGFNYDSQNLSPIQNLANKPEFNDVMYRGKTGMNCVEVYTFRKSPKNTCANYTDISFSPRLGMLKATEYTNPNFAKEKHEIKSNLELVSINHVPVDQYVDKLCQGSIMKDPSNTTISAAPPVVDLTPRGTTPTPTKPKAEESVVEFYSMEDFSSEFGEPTAEMSDPNFVPECNAVQLPGYHIVRPKQTLYSISRMTGIAVDQLVAWNGIKDKSYVPLCTELRLSEPLPTMYDKLQEKMEQGVVEKSPTPPEEEIPASYDVTTDVTVDDHTDKNVNIKPSKKTVVVKQGQNGIHIVQEGETLYSIARVYGYTSERFIEMNGLNTDVVTPGMELFTTDCACNLLPDAYGIKGIKQVDSRTHTLQKGETIYQISKKYGVSVERIIQDNGIGDEKNLAVGQVLVIGG